MADFDPVSYMMGQKGGGGGGSSALSGLTDVDISNPTDGQVLVYDATSGKWENGAGGVLVVTLNDQTWTLDHTAQQLIDAGVRGVVTLIIDQRQHGDNDVFFNSLTSIAYDSDGYWVVSFGENNHFYAKELDDYPSVDPPEVGGGEGG